MAESIVDKIKAKLGGIKINLPFLKKKDADAEEVDENYNKANKKMDDIGMDAKGAHVAAADKTNPGVTAPGESTEANDLEDIKASEKPKSPLFRPIGKTKFTPVHILVVVGALYFGYDYMMGESGPSEEELMAQMEAPKKDPNKKKKKKKKDAEAGTEAGTEAGATTPDTATAGTETPPADAGTTPPVDLGTSTETPTSTTEPKVSDVTPIPEGGEANIDKIDVSELNVEAEKIDKQKEAEAKATPVPEETPAVSSSGEETKSTEETLSMTTGESTASETPQKENTDLASDLLKNLEDGEKKAETDVSQAKETTPPDYTRPGRGLVYNCKDGHWACIGRDEYSTCKANRQWNEKNSKKLECFEVSVYATDKDCGTAQRIKVDTVAQTDFCK